MKIERARTMRSTNRLARGSGKRLLLGGRFRSGDRHHFILQSGAANDEQDPRNQEHQRSSSPEASVPEVTENERAKGKNDIGRPQAKAENGQISLHAVHSLN
ncbi:hypothetical protein [Pyramidobacter porci]|uniref:hypothetical protein n=1 Tax=Pyramidobacter porci TaxID=2605789 RepID=UPI0018A6AAC1|nr:hypothetical protein [Pyramidobacter porci]